MHHEDGAGAIIHPLPTGAIFVFPISVKTRQMLQGTGATEHHAEMKLAYIILSIAGALFGGLALILLMNGWLGWVPYPLMAGGALFVAAAVAGAVSDRSSPPTAEMDGLR